MLQEVITRKEARERGLKRYHDNCPKHGFVERYTCNGACVREQSRNQSPEYISWNT